MKNAGKDGFVFLSFDVWKRNGKNLITFLDKWSEGTQRKQDSVLSMFWNEKRELDKDLLVESMKMLSLAVLSLTTYCRDKNSS